MPRPSAAGWRSAFKIMLGRSTVMSFLLGTCLSASLGIVLGCMLDGTAAQAQLAFQTIYQFFPSAQSYPTPYGRLAESTDGSFYGTLDGNNTTYGSIFRFTPGSGVTYPVNFDSSTGYQPY